MELEGTSVTVEVSTLDPTQNLLITWSLKVSAHTHTHIINLLNCVMT